MTQKTMKKMGRTLGSSNFSRLLNESGGGRMFILASGQEAHFELVHISNDNIEDQTFVDAAVNGRNQSLITQQSVADICRTIKLQQFFPAIGRWVDNRIEILDGSRRRYACLYERVTFDVLVTKDAISITDARQLAIDLQTAKEHTLRELGKRLQLMYPSDMSQSDIAKSEGLSPSKITRAYQAASISDEVMELFTPQTEFSINDYQTLLDIEKNAAARQIHLTDVVASVRKSLSASINNDSDVNADKNMIVNLLRSAVAETVRQKPTGVVTEKIGEFSDRKQFARKKTHAEKRLVTYEFSRLPTAYQTELDDAVKSIILKMQTEGLKRKN